MPNATSSLAARNQDIFKLHSFTQYTSHNLKLQIKCLDAKPSLHCTMHSFILNFQCTSNFMQNLSCLHCCNQISSIVKFLSVTLYCMDLTIHVKLKNAVLIVEYEPNYMFLNCLTLSISNQETMGRTSSTCFCEKGN